MKINKVSGNLKPRSPFAARLINLNIQFTRELEDTNGQGLTFLDTVSIRKGTQLEINVYRKPARMERYLNISFLTTPCAIRDLWSVPCCLGHRTYHQHRKGNAKKHSRSRLYCESKMFPRPSSTAAKDHCRNSPPIYRPTALWCYPICREFRKGLVES